MDLILHRREERNLELKQEMDWTDKRIQCKMVKSILAMSNLTDGGTIIVGMRQNGEQFEPDGIEPALAAKYTQDRVAAVVSEYADPFVELSVHQVEHDSKMFVVIEVREFAETPVLCKKDGQEGLQRGVLFVRRRRIHETGRIQTYAEMRELLDRAVEKGLRSFHMRLARAGLGVVSPQAADKKRFDDELGEL